MNGDELLAAFLEFIEKERPERFFPLKYAGRENGMRTDWVPDPDWKIVVAKEACYGAYDAVLYRRKRDFVYEVIPVEVKADTDVLDKRLRAQLWVHIKNFGRSMLILGKEQAFKVKKRKLLDLLPSEIWAYNGLGFVQLTKPICKYDNEGAASISQRALEKAFNIHEPKKLRILQKRLWKIRRVIATLEANQWRFAEEQRFSPQEAAIAFEIFGFHLNPVLIEDLKKIAAPAVKKTVESKTAETVIQKQLSDYKKRLRARK